MLDRRCRIKVRTTQDFYLFRKHGYYYYAFFPNYKITRSTGELELQDAYRKAWEIFTGLDLKVNLSLYRPFADNKKRQRELNHILGFVDQTKLLTSSIITRLQKKLLSEGLSGKSINNYIYTLQKSYTEKFPEWKPLEHEAVYRSCFPITSFYGFYRKCSTRLHYLAFIAMTTGARAGELSKMYPVTVNNRLYIQINGTKTKNAVRKVPALPETVACLHYLQNGFRSSAYKESVVEAGNVCGFDNKYIEENNIVFHGFRKMYKTLLVSANVNTQYSEMLMGHSQTRTVNQLYFVGNSMDDSLYYDSVITALKHLL